MSSGFYGSNREYNPHGGTPDDLLEQIQNEFGELFDPCPNDFQIDGLSIDWPLDMATFCNPPYTRGEITKWMKKVHDESLRGCQIILLIPNYSDTKAFHSYVYHSADEIRCIKGRLKFKGYGGKPASFPSILCIYNKDVNLI